MMDLKDFEPFSPAEQKMIDEAGLPNRTVLADGTLPSESSDAVQVRADLVRFLLISMPLHDKGIRLRGAWVTGSLDLQGCDCNRDVSLSACHLVEPMNLTNARLRGLHISGCRIGGVSADNATFSGSIYFRAGTHIEGEISLSGATVNGDLQLCDAVIESSAQDAIFAPSLRVRGSVFLGNYPYADGETSLVTTGQIFLSSARVEHDFFLTNTAITLNDSALNGAVFGATEEHGSNIAISLARARIGGILYLQDNQISRGIFNLAGGHAERLKDEPVGPGAAYPIRLDGFTYSDFSRHAQTNVKARLEWLARRPQDTPFTAQPYEQLANVMARMGHRNDARTVLMRKERLLKAENRRLSAERGGFAVWRALSWVNDLLLRYTIGYGFRPARAVVIAIALILGLGWFFERTWDAGDMTPNAAPVLVSAGWISATETHPKNPGAFWSSVGQAGQDWETFNGYAYAADLVVPIVSLGQETAWAPSTSRSDWGRAGWWMRWFAKAIGWIVTALGAGAITGVIRKE
ncbi:hypothetical protein [uncultured Litoreibacter sp.]|uniref:hypothetical protein n=1 Tax=uncultured Litoreibacter sp. TaxID=1392394 RepID=UPI002611C236|nr:hypothetical protein [uncultured Litoreibacter sp.]